MNEFHALLAAYAVAGTAIALYARKLGVKDHVDFFIAGRNVSGVISALTYAATTYSAFMMVGLVGYTYASGVGAAAFELFYLVGTLFLLSTFARKIWQIAKDYEIVSPAELIGHFHGRSAAIAAALVSLIALIPYTSIQIIGVSLLLEKTGITYTSAVFVTTALVVLWALIGGLRGVAWTDAVQGGVMLFAAVAAVLWVYQWGFSDVSFISEVERLGELLVVPNSFWTPAKFAGLTVPWFFFALTNPQVVQRLFIPKDSNALRKMILLFGGFGLIYTVLVTFLGLELRTLTEIGKFPLVSNADAVTPTLLTLMPGWLFLLVAFSILAAAITTANSIVLALSSIVSRDIAGEKGLAVGQVAVLGISMAVAVFALMRPGYIVELAVLSSTILLSLLPPTLAILGVLPLGRRAGAITILMGTFTAIMLMALHITPAGIPASLWVLFVSLAIYTALTFKQRSR
ncbi:sodium:solute symporter family protein [Archaeoglobus veneficus]|uniref:Na+/solute symporter n=1 Tax=Archaeoglobus veneficus (strain DSM 11195 / SNP6) TaxID=693661 RepID=F2KPC9_ARCVS|nr:sodium:solute symporter family protein [Archaeoglobus veneficus]AEA47533.1 Na+/solute symporter [Archaeoglobus veneficus SNP6]